MAFAVVRAAREGKHIKYRDVLPRLTLRLKSRPDRIAISELLSVKGFIDSYLMISTEIVGGGFACVEVCLHSRDSRFKSTKLDEMFGDKDAVSLLKLHHVTNASFSGEGHEERHYNLDGSPI